MKNQNPATTIDSVIQVWIEIELGSPRGFLADNKGEFANEKFRICENLNIYNLDTAVKSPGLNGV